MPKVGRILETILRISGTALGQLWDSSGTAPRQLWDSSGAALGQLWDSSGTALGQLWGSFATALGQLWNSSGMMTTTMMIFVFQFYIYKLPINRPSGRYVNF